ncbi:MAG: aspartate 1-decarboxylase [Crocinitomicaceae bacterium]|nr:aspartate 1-decarboxylase [Crocinitomicaceae bacterium]
MLREFFRAKIHRVTVTEAEVDYIGSITIDPDLLEAANMMEGEKVQVLSCNNGERLETYIIKGERGSGEICVNGPAALKIGVGHVVIVIAYAMMTEEEAKDFKPTIVFPNENNKLS